jgi:uncharacterized protein (DUF934 family)
MKVIKDKKVIELKWGFYVEDTAVVDAENLIFPYVFFEENRQQLLSRTGQTGVSLSGETPVEIIKDDLANLPLIALEFPKFADGRCFSHATKLRVNYGYKGEILAFGDILRDQLAHMLRCGINMVHFPAERDIEDALKGFDEFTTPYQMATDDQKIIDDLR